MVFVPCCQRSWRAVREIDPALPLANVQSLDAVSGAAMATRRLTLWLVATFGLTALFLAIVGIYGVIAESVGQRTQSSVSAKRWAQLAPISSGWCCRAAFG